MIATGRITAKRLAELFGIAIAFIVIWLVIGLFTASEFYRRSIAMRGEHEAILNVLVVQGVTALVWATITPILVAIAERLPLRKPVLARNALILVAMLPIIAVIRAIIGSAALNLGEHHAVSMDMIRLSISIRTHRNIGIGAMIFVVTNLVMAQREAAARARRELAAQTLLTHAELEELRAQMQPHFLFLTLQTIAEVVHVNPGAADDMIVGLADLLRSSLALGNEPVPLANELEFVDRTLALYQVCFGGKLAIRFDADDDVLVARVPPLLVQQLVEHAVVNGIAPAGKGDIDIRGWRDETQLRIAVSDSGASLSRDDVQGLAAVRTRLEKLFGDAHSLVVERRANRCVTTVSMPLFLAPQPAALEEV